MNFIAFGASSSRQSINKQLATAAAQFLAETGEHDIEILDLNDFEMPIFSEDIEKEIGQPEPAQRFMQKIADADGIIISFAEHNGTYTAAYKNIFDWASRINYRVFQKTPAVYFAAAPGAKGGASVLSSAVESAPFFHAELKASLSVPKFAEVFDSETQTFIDADMKQKVRDAVMTLVS